MSPNPVALAIGLLINYSVLRIVGLYVGGGVWGCVGVWGEGRGRRATEEARAPVFNNLF